jgi:outer membrane receptor for ferrienterochelin and colicins
MPSPLRLPVVFAPAHSRSRLLAACLPLASFFSHAQTAPAPANPASAPVVTPQQVEITGARAADAAARRASTAAKIVIGREEIESYGDTSVAEVLKRLPGVTLSGPPGRGGPPRMRGLGAGYTQILLDGQRIPPGFSIETLTPDQIERIEILRAPTAETGARAIGGTINIITREGFSKRLNDVRLGVAYENGHAVPNLGWTRNGGDEALSYNFSLSTFRNERAFSAVGKTTVRNLSTSLRTAEEEMETQTLERRAGLHATGRLQWRLGVGDNVTLMPIVFFGEGSTRRAFALEQALPLTPPRFDHGTDDGAGHFGMARLNLMANTRVGETRLELRTGAGLGENYTHNEHLEYNAAQAVSLRQNESTRSREPSVMLNLKASRLTLNDHQLVMGAEVDSLRREETRFNRVEKLGTVLQSDDGETFTARSLRTAAYAQDEWKLSPQWAVHGGLRWEGISTHGQAADGTPSDNRSAVWTPLLHAVWRPEEKSRDQVRFSLTRSYRSPTLQNLIGRVRRNLEDDRNSPTRPYSAGNPDLRPEMATGLDVALERYLQGGGVFSANVFARRITDYMRSVTQLEEVSPGVLRYVARPRNVGGALTSGIELEAKFRMTEVWSQAPPVDVRANASVFRSKVDAVPGPNNRLDSQPPGTLNLGFDYKLRNGLPLTVGANTNFTPGFRTQVSSEQFQRVSAKTVWDAYALWVLQPGMQLRLSGSNLDAQDYRNQRGLNLGTVEELSDTTSRSYTNWSLRLEMKL